MGMIAELFVKLGLKKDGFDKGLDDTKKKTNELNVGMKKLGGMIAGVFAVGAITGFVRGIIQTRSEFEKYEAVLTNTLGSQKQAREEMRMLQEFAAKTPFALTELTGAYVKMVNYGLKPTREELTKLGDLASSTGKGFDQLVEGVADAVTGQYERLKEFGIKAAKSGNQVTFTFKEQATTVDNTAASIKAYLVGLGDLKGVSGSMAAISETLGGRVSNLGDAWDGLMNTMGSQSSGVMNTTLKWLTAMTKGADNLLTSIEELNNVKGGDTFNSILVLLAVRIGLVSKETVKARIETDKLEKSLRASRQATIDRLNSELVSKETNPDPKDDPIVLTAVEQLAAIRKVNDELEAQRILRKEFYGEGMTAIPSIGSPDNVGTTDIDSNALGNMSSHNDKNLEDLENFTEDYMAEYNSFISELNNAINQGLATAISSMAEGLGELFSGEIGGKEFGNQILQTVGRFMQTLGGLLIAYAINMALFSESAKNPLSWPVALGAGIAMVAAGAAISGFAGKGLSGASSGGGGGAYSGGYSGGGSQAALAVNVGGSFELHGTTLKAAIHNTDRKNNLIR